jgi:Trk K+ transport system NAD-binding subunit
MVQVATPPSRAARGERRQRYSWWQTLRASLYDVETAVAIALLIIVLVINVLYQLSLGALSHGIGNLVVQTLESLSLQNLGMQNINGALGQAIFVINILFYVLFAQSLLEIVQIFVRRRPEARQIGLAATLRDHVIVCGLGRIGYRIVSRLAASGYQVVVIERDPTSAFINRVAALRVPIIQGEASEAYTLNRAGVKHACAVIACIDGDLVNLEIALAARGENANIRVILRAFGEDFDQGFETSFGARTAFSASKLAAPTFAAAALSRNIEHVVSVGDHLFGTAEFVLAREIDPATFEQAHGVRILTRTQAGNATRVAVMGEINALRRLNEASGGEPVQGDGTIIVCGLGKVGYRVVRLLHEQRAQFQPSVRIVVIHRDEEAHSPLVDDRGNAIDRVGRSFTKEILDLDGVEIRLGDARDPDMLRSAGIATASAVVAITSDDQTNVQIGLEARNVRHDVHVVLRVFSDALAEKLGDLFKIRTAYSTSDLASPTMAAAAVLGGVDAAFFVDDDLFALEAIPVTTNHWLARNTVGGTMKARGIAVVAVQHAGMITPLPPADTAIAVGDVVTVVAALRTLEQLRKRP